MSATNKQTSMKQISVVIATLISSLFFAQSAFAETASTNMQVTAVVKSSCVVSNATMNFGTYDPAGANSNQDLKALGNISVKCTAGTSATISLSSGNQGSGASRAMMSADGKDRLSYQIYTDSNNSTVWNETNKVNYVASSANQANLNVYGKIPANQQVSDGVYSDTVNVVVNF